MKLFVLICLSLQLLVAPVCQAALSCSQGMADVSPQDLSGHGAHSGLAAPEAPVAIDCEHCDDASVLGDNQILTVVSTHETAHDLVFATGSTLREDSKLPASRTPPDVTPVASQSLWRQTRRIRL